MGLFSPARVVLACRSASAITASGSSPASMRSRKRSAESSASLRQASAAASKDVRKAVGSDCQSIARARDEPAGEANGSAGKYSRSAGISLSSRISSLRNRTALRRLLRLPAETARPIRSISSCVSSSGAQVARDRSIARLR